MKNRVKEALRWFLHVKSMGGKGETGEYMTCKWKEEEVIQITLFMLSLNSFILPLHKIIVTALANYN